MSTIDRKNIEQIGEVLNLSMSTASNAVSIVLEKETHITAFDVNVCSLENADLSAFEPAVFAEYDFTQGLTGKSLLAFKESDIKKLVGVVLQKEFTDEEFELDEISLSALDEVLSPLVKKLYQSASSFAGKDIKVDSPKPFEAIDTKSSLANYYSVGEEVVIVKFKLVVTGVTDSEIVVIYNKNQASEIVSNFGVKDTAPVANEAVPQQPVQQQDNSYVAQNNSAYDVRPAELTRFNDAKTSLSSEDKSTNLNMIMNVPLQISVEIGNTKKQIKDILELTTGSIIELNKQAGAPVDIYVNGKLIANGEVVVVDEYYGVKISEILNNGEIMKIL